MRSIDIRVDGRKLVLERITDEALGGQVIDLVRLHQCHDLVEARVTFQGRRMQLYLVEEVSNPPEPVFRILQRHPANNAMDLVFLIKQQFGQIGTVLTSNASD